MLKSNDIKINNKIHFCLKGFISLPLYTQRCYGRNYIALLNMQTTSGLSGLIP